MNGNVEGVKELVRKNGIKEIVGIRGVSLKLGELVFEVEPVDTAMWNPLHFAVYFQHIDLVKYFLEDLKVNVGVTAPSANAESELEQYNNERFSENKFLLPYLAIDGRNP